MQATGAADPESCGTDFAALRFRVLAAVRYARAHTTDTKEHRRGG